MDTMIGAFGAVLAPDVLVVLVLASVFGVLLGSIPGLTATMGAALLVPVTFFLDPLPAIAAVVAVAASAIFAGDLPGALLRIPGTPASAAYCDDTYALTRQGKGAFALTFSLVATCIGGLLGTLVLVLAAPTLARFALGFSSVEYFWLACLGLSSAVIVSGPSKLKGLASLFIGLFVATIGVDVIGGHPRFTFGTVELMGGVSFIPALIGMFALAEILRNLKVATPLSAAQIPPQERRGTFRFVGENLARYPLRILRGGGTGTMIGILPGAGADIAAWIAYAVSRKTSKTPEAFGKGTVEGVGEASAANNAALGGAWVPTLVYGIPGDTITAIAIGVLMVKGIQPGPTVFMFQADLMYAIFAAFFVANLMLLPIGYAAIRAGQTIVRVPQNILLPMILLFCVVGAFGTEGSTFGIVVMLVIGLVGWVMAEHDMPLAPAILGIVLGDMIEFNFVTSLMKSNGDLWVFFSRPIGAVLGVVTILVWTFPLLKAAVERLVAAGRKRRRSRA